MTGTRLLPLSYATGNQIPTDYVIPDCVGNDCLDAVDLLDSAGLTLMDWQAVLLQAWMGYGADGKWTAKNCGNETPRQNGKTLVIQGRAAVEMLVYGGTVLYTSQLQKTSTETFNEFKKLFENRKLRKYVAPNGVKTALGREEIILKNGARIKFLARTRNGGDGQHGSLLIFDEAQALDHASQESFLFAISACRTERGSQVIYNGTCPKDSDYGLVYEKIRDDAISGKTKSTAWTEWSAGYGGAVPDVTDRVLWERVNPSYGILIMPDTVEAECESAEAEKFAHQRLGWYTARKTGVKLIPDDLWALLESEHPSKYDKLAAGIRVSQDGVLITCCFAMKVDDEHAHVEFIKQAPFSAGLTWVVDLLKRHANELAMICIDGKSGADELARRLVSAGIRKTAVKCVGTSGAIDSAAMLVNMVNDKLLTHLKDDALDESATQSVKRKIGGSGGFGFGGECPDIIESASLALYGAMTTKRNPNRKAVVRC